MIFGYYDPEQFLKAVGPGLEHIDFVLNDDTRAAKSLACVKKYCRNLHSLAIATWTGCLSIDGVTDLVVSYSTKLETVKVPALSLKQYQEIASKCPEVDCTVECHASSVDDAMLGLQDRLVCLYVTAMNPDEGDIIEERPMEDLKLGTLKCSRLRKLNFHGQGRATQMALRKIAPLVQTSLEVLKITANYFCEIVPDLLDPQSSLPTLRQFFFHGETKFFCFEGLGSSCPALEAVEIVCSPIELNHADEFCTLTVAEFLDRKCLKELCILVPSITMNLMRTRLVPLIRIRIASVRSSNPLLRTFVGSASNTYRAVMIGPASANGARKKKALQSHEQLGTAIDTDSSSARI